MAQNTTFANYLKQNTNIGLSTDAAVARVAHEGLDAYDSLLDFDPKAIKSLQTACKETVPAIIAADGQTVVTAAIPGVHLPMRSILRLVEAVYAAKYYNSIGRSLNVRSLHFDNVLSDYLLERKAYDALKENTTEGNVPLLLEKDGDRKVINWVPSFRDYCSSIFGALGPLSYILRDESDVPSEADDPLDQNKHFGKAGSLFLELEARLPHDGPIFRQDNGRIYMKIAEAVKGTSVDSTIKPFMRTKDGRGAFQALISSHAGAVKYRSLRKKAMFLLQNVKWTGNNSTMESHVSKHRRAHDQITECSSHIACQGITDPQKVEYLLDSITCENHDVRAAMGIIRNTRAKRDSFEEASSTLIEIDPYRPTRSARSGDRNVKISAASADEYGKTGVRLRWPDEKEFCQLSLEKRTELLSWMATVPDTIADGDYQDEFDDAGDDDVAAQLSSTDCSDSSDDAEVTDDSSVASEEEPLAKRMKMSDLTEFAELVAQILEQKQSASSSGTSKKSTSKKSATVSAFEASDGNATSVTLPRILKRKK